MAVSDAVGDWGLAAFLALNVVLVMLLRHVLHTSARARAWYRHFYGVRVYAPPPPAGHAATCQVYDGGGCSCGKGYS